MNRLRTFARAVWRLVRSVAGRIWGNPLLMLGIVILAIAAVNHRTLMANLPTSVPELTVWLAEREPVVVTMNGELAGLPLCWQMRFTFLEESGAPLLREKSYIVNIGTPRPRRTITLPPRDSYLIRTGVEVTNAEVDNHCVPVGGVAIMRAKTFDVTTGELAARQTINNLCTAVETGLDCRIEYE